MSWSKNGALIFQQASGSAAGNVNSFPKKNLNFIYSLTNDKRILNIFFCTDMGSIFHITAPAVNSTNASHCTIDT